MECLIGIRGSNFVVLASDNISSRYVLSMKRDQDKTFKLSDKLVMAVCGDPGDAVQFAEYVSKNVQLYRMRNGYDLSVKETVNFTRRNLAESLRSSSAYNVNMLIGGYDDRDGPGLYFMDYLASSVSVPYAGHGYGAMFSLSVLDRYYKPDLTEDEAIVLMQKCIDEIATRLVINLGKFNVKVIDKKGIRDREPLTPVPVPGMTDAQLLERSRGAQSVAAALPGVQQPVV